MSSVTCHMSRVTFQFKKKKKFLLFFSSSGQSKEASPWKVCYQQGLPCVVNKIFTNSLLLERCLCVCSSKFTLCLPRNMPEVARFPAESRSEWKCQEPMSSSFQSTQTPLSLVQTFCTFPLSQAVYFRHRRKADYHAHAASLCASISMFWGHKNL